MPFAGRATDRIGPRPRRARRARARRSWAMLSLTQVSDSTSFFAGRGHAVRDGPRPRRDDDVALRLRGRLFQTLTARPGGTRDLGAEHHPAGRRIDRDRADGRRARISSTAPLADHPPSRASAAAQADPGRSRGHVALAPVVADAFRTHLLVVAGDPRAGADPRLVPARGVGAAGSADARGDRGRPVWSRSCRSRPPSLLLQPAPEM